MGQAGHVSQGQARSRKRPVHKARRPGQARPVVCPMASRVSQARKGQERPGKASVSQARPEGQKASPQGQARQGQKASPQGQARPGQSYVPGPVHKARPGQSYVPGPGHKARVERGSI
jgi:hypothetical protein